MSLDTAFILVTENPDQATSYLPAPAAQSRNRSLVSKILSLTGFLLVVAVLLTAGILLFSNSRILEKQSRDHADALATYIASLGEYPLATGEVNSLGSVVYHAFADKTVIRIVITDASGQPMCEVNRPNLSADNIADLKSVEAIRVQGTSASILSRGNAIRVIRPIVSETDDSATQAGKRKTSFLGTIELVVSIADQRAAIRRTEVKTGITSILFVIVFLLIQRVQLKRILSPLGRLTTLARRVGDGELDLRVATHSDDEIGKLSRTFNTMLDQRKAAQLDLLKAIDEAQAANRLKSEFLANMSHEIRTPINGIMGMTQLALCTVLTEEQQDCLRTIQSSSNSLLSIINDILDFSKIEAGHLSIDPFAFALREHINDAVRTVAVLAHEKHLELLVDIDPVVPDALFGDALRLRQILLNLLNNAIKFTAQGEVELSVRTLELTDSDCLLAFSVRDTGIGIAPEKAAMVFKPFVQADGSTTRKHGGTGLGLAISSELARLLGGTIDLASEPSHGSTFRVTTRFRLGQRQRETTPLCRRPRTLIVDDNATNRKILERMLAGWEIPAESVDSAGAALHVLHKAHSAGEPYELLLSDVCMPERDGLALIEQLRQEPESANLPIIVLSSSDTFETLQRCRQLGVARYLSKPVADYDLKRAIFAEFCSPEHTNAPLAAISAPTPAPSPDPLKILLAEDNLINQRVALGMLKRLGHSVTVAGDGEQALEILDRHEFDLILMDLQMPKLDGFETTEALRKTARGASVPVIALTANAMQGDRERCLNAGMDEYLSKPIHMEDLQRLLQAVTTGSLRPVTP